jgi:TonB family protein
MKQARVDRPRRSALFWKLPILACALVLTLAGGIDSTCSAEDDPIYMNTEVKPPERTGFVEPDYPDELRRAGVEGKVGLEIAVGRSGSVDDVRVIRSNPPFDEAAVKAVRQWSYRPALQDGKPVKVFMTVVVEFNLGGLPKETLPVYLTSGIKPPERTVFVQPEYPEQARKDEVEGKVVIEIIVNSAGDEDGDRVVTPNSVFDDAALLAVRQWKYKPALKAGKPVKVYLTVSVEFKLK